MDDKPRLVAMSAARDAGALARLKLKLARNDKQKFLPTVNNAMLILAEDPELRGSLLNSS